MEQDKSQSQLVLAVKHKCTKDNRWVSYAPVMFHVSLVSGTPHSPHSPVRCFCWFRRSWPRPICIIRVSRVSAIIMCAFCITRRDAKITLRGQDAAVRLSLSLSLRPELCAVCEGITYKGRQEEEIVSVRAHNCN